MSYILDILPTSDADCQLKWENYCPANEMPHFSGTDQSVSRYALAQFQPIKTRDRTNSGVSQHEMSQKSVIMRSLLASLAFLLVCLGPKEVGADLTVIREDNWRDLLTGEWMVEFFAPWCPACRGLQPTWEEFGGWSEDLEIGVGQVDVTASPGLSGRFMVTALPTIFHVKEGVFRQYRGARDKDSFISFVEDKKWQATEPVSSWKSPDSFQMSMVSYFFKLSMVLRNVHTTLTEDYQMPSWVSYVAFALATIVLGGILGLLLVCCIDCVYPPSRSREEEQVMVRTEEKEEENDLLDDDVSQDEGDEDEDTQEENLSQDEDSQEEEEGSQAEEESQEEDNFRAENKTRRRRVRKAD